MIGLFYTRILKLLLGSPLHLPRPRREGIVGERKHIATCALFGGFTGHRTGTRYFYEHAEAIENQSRPMFRWRNEKCRLQAVADTRRAGSAGCKSPEVFPDPTPSSVEER
jgi:hypothetical protein